MNAFLGFNATSLFLVYRRYDSVELKCSIILVYANELAMIIGDDARTAARGVEDPDGRQPHANYVPSP